MTDSRSTARSPHASWRSSLVLLLVLVGPSVTHAQDPTPENEVGLFVGGWFGEDFLIRTIQADDPFLGPVTFGSALEQGNALVFGVRYTGYFNDWFGADLVLGYAANEWTTIAGRVTNGVLTGQVDVISGVNTIPFSLNALARARLTDRGPNPFVSAGLGGVWYEFSQVTGPIVITPSAGMPLDTLLFDLDLGLRVAPNVSGGVLYRISGQVGIRAEGRVWFTMLREQLADETLWQRNAWFTLSGSYFF